jgi:hypothetical protein
MASTVAASGQVSLLITIAPPPLPVYEQPLYLMSYFRNQSWEKPFQRDPKSDSPRAATD